MLHEVLQGSLGAGAANLSPAAVRSYEARLKHLSILAEQMRPIGNMLADMGPLAPPCLALPYEEICEKLQDAAVKILASIKAHGTQDQWDRFETAMGGGELFPEPKGRATGPIDSIASLPRLTEYWTSAPACWWGTFTVPSSAGKLGALPLLPPSRSSIPRVIFTRAGAARAGSWASRLWNTPLVRSARAAGRFFEKALIVLFVADFAWEKARDIYSWIAGEEPPPDVSAEVDAAIAFYNNDFWPEIAQQLEGVMLATASAGSNPAALLQALLAIDPTKLPPPSSMGPDGTEDDWRKLVPHAVRRGNPWAALATLIGGTAVNLGVARYA